MKMASNPILRLDLVDVYDQSLGESVDVILRHTVLSDVVRTTVKTKGPVDIAGLKGAPQGSYRIDIDPPSYQHSTQFLNMRSSGITTLSQSFGVDPKKVVSLRSPGYSTLLSDLKRLLEQSGRVLGFETLSGQALYVALKSDDIRLAGLLNIAAKTNMTRFGGDRTVLSAITQLLEIRGDRFFARVPKQLREDTKNSVAAGLFAAVSGSLHHPPLGYSHAGSFKTPDHYGNLQLTFFMNGEDCVADIDIDDAGGIEHVFQVLKNMISGEPTHPYNIHEILVKQQGIDPGYKFNLS
jgi:hypothetical protein